MKREPKTSGWVLLILIVLFFAVCFLFVAVAGLHDEVHGGSVVMPMLPRPNVTALLLQEGYVLDCVSWKNVTRQNPLRKEFFNTGIALCSGDSHLRIVCDNEDSCGFVGAYDNPYGGAYFYDHETLSGAFSCILRVKNSTGALFDAYEYNETMCTKEAWVRRNE